MFDTQPRIKTIAQRMLVGMHAGMSLTADSTRELWRSFMPRRMEISGRLSEDLYSMQVYGSSFDFKDFNVHTMFEKWAAVEVESFGTLPAGMDAFTLPGGLYAVFLHRGAASTGPATFSYIFGTWLPASAYAADNARPHFEILGEKYKNDHPDSEEEIWVPVKLRT